MKLSQVPLATRQRLYAQTVRNAVRTQRIDAETYLVSSQSQEGLWYEVTPSTCPCKGNANVGYCSHRIRVSADIYLDSKAGAPTPIARPSNISRIA